MEIKDKSSVIFGNQIDKKTIKQGIKSKNKFLKKYGDDTNDGDEFAPDGCEKIDSPDDGNGRKEDPSRRSDKCHKNGQCKDFWNSDSLFLLHRPDGQPRNGTYGRCVERFRHDGGVPSGELRIQGEEQPRCDGCMERETIGSIGFKGRIHDGGAGEAGHEDLQGYEWDERMATGERSSGDGDVSHVGFLRLVEWSSVDDFLSTVDIPPRIACETNAGGRFGTPFRRT